MPAFIKTPAQEKKWEKAKEIASEQGHKEDWPYITGIYKRMNKGKVGRTNQQVIEAPHSFSLVKLEPPKAKRKQYPFEGFIDFQGLEIDVENAKGSTRSGESPDGSKWSTYMNYHYGEIRGTEGVDSDKLDAYVGDNHDSPIVTVIHQHNPWDGKYDEDKVMLGFDSVEEAIGAYKKQYDKPGYYKDGEYTAMTMGKFWRWVTEEKNMGKRIATKVASKAYPKDLLPVLKALQAAYQTLHWSTKGPNFYGDHLMYERLYNSVTEEIDAVAEKLVQAFGPESVEIEGTISSTHNIILKRFKPQALSLQAAIQLELEFIAYLEVLLQSRSWSSGWRNHLEGVADQHEGHLYLLGQRSST